MKVGEEESASCRRPVVTTQVSFSKNQVLRAVRRLTNLEANAMICLSAFALKKISNGHDDEQDVPDKKGSHWSSESAKQIAGSREWKHYLNGPPCIYNIPDLTAAELEYLPYAFWGGMLGCIFGMLRLYI